MRVLFAGTPTVAVPALEAIHGSSHDVVGVLTRPPAPVGRKRVLTPSLVHQRAQELHLPVHTGPVNSPELAKVLAAADCVAVVAYGALIKEPALSIPPRGWINLHFSLLPRWRGAAPVHHAIMAGDTRTGVSVFQIDTGLDTGPVYATEEEPIHPTDTTGDVLERLVAIGTPLLLEVLDAIADGTARAVPQTGEATTAPTLHSADGRILWHAPAREVVNTIRGLTPAPGAWTCGEGGRFKIGPVRPAPGVVLTPGQVHISGEGVFVGTGTEAVELGRIAPPGKPWMQAVDWRRGLRVETFSFEGKA